MRRCLSDILKTLSSCLPEPSPGKRDLDRAKLAPGFLNDDSVSTGSGHEGWTQIRVTLTFLESAKVEKW